MYSCCFRWICISVFVLGLNPVTRFLVVFVDIDMYPVCLLCMMDLSMQCLFFEHTTFRNSVLRFFFIPVTGFPFTNFLVYF